VGSLRHVREIPDYLGLRWLRAHKPDLRSVRSRLHRPVLRRWQLGILLGFGAVVFLFVLFVAVDGGLYYNEIHHGIRVAGQDLGGLSCDEATAALTTLVEDTRKQSIVLTRGDESWKVLPRDVGTTIDVPAAVSTAMSLTRDGNAFVDLGRRIGLYFSGRNLPLQGTVDDAKVDELLDELAEELDRQPRNARMVFYGDQITIAEEKPGVAVDKDALGAQLTALLFMLDGTELQVPMVVTEPDIGAADVSPALEDASTMISSDLVLTHGDLSWTFTPRDIASFMDLTYKTVGGVSTMVPTLSAAKMRVFFDGIEDSVDTPGVNATMDSDGQTVWVVPAVDGQVLDRERTAAALSNAALWVHGRTAGVVLTAMDPDLTTAEVKDMGIEDLLASYATTPYRGSKNRQNNVRLGTSLCSGILLAPGEEFNTDKRLGKRDRAHGWRTAPGIVGNGQLKNVYGGGICQVSTTLFNAVFEAGLEIVERHNHSMFIGHYPYGRDATVAGGGGKNMRFRNDTDHYIFIWGKSTGVVTEFYVWGISDGRTVTSSFSGFRGRRCTVTRTVIWPDGTAKTEEFVSRYVY
jgi:vancomycin resistance protein YoaR